MRGARKPHLRRWLTWQGRRKAEIARKQPSCSIMMREASDLAWLSRKEFEMAAASKYSIDCKSAWQIIIMLTVPDLLKLNQALANVLPTSVKRQAQKYISAISQRAAGYSADKLGNYSAENNGEAMQCSASTYQLAFLAGSIASAEFRRYAWQYRRNFDIRSVFVARQCS